MTLALVAAVVAFWRWRSSLRTTSPPPVRPRLLLSRGVPVSSARTLTPAGNLSTRPALYAWLPGVRAGPGRAARPCADSPLVAMFFLTVPPRSAHETSSGVSLGLVKNGNRRPARRRFSTRGTRPRPGCRRLDGRGPGGPAPGERADAVGRRGRAQIRPAASAQASHMPAVYRFVRRLPGRHPILVEFPFGVVAWGDPVSLTCSTFHWYPIRSTGSAVTPPRATARRVEPLLDPARDPDAAWDCGVRAASGSHAGSTRIGAHARRIAGV